jgi:hypothetical protein
MAYKDTFKTAMDKIMTTLIATLGGTEGKDVFRYYLPLAVPVWGVWLGGGGDVSNTWSDGQPTELRMDAEIVGRFVQPAAAQEWGMKAISALPIFESGNVQWFRMRQGGQLKIDFVVAQLKNDTKESILFEATIGCECVFLTSGTFA